MKVVELLPFEYTHSALDLYISFKQINVDSTLTQQFELASTFCGSLTHRAFGAKMTSY